MKDQYLSSFQRYGDKGIPARLKKHVRKRVLAIFTTYMENRLKVYPSELLSVQDHTGIVDKNIIQRLLSAVNSQFLIYRFS